MDDQVLIHILETACSEENLIFQVIEQERYLHVFLNREADQVLDYQVVGRKIFQAFSRLSLTDIDGVCLYSRVLGQEEPDWEAKFRLPQAKQIAEPAAEPVAAQQVAVQQGAAQPVAAHAGAQAQPRRATTPTAQSPAQQQVSEAVTYIMQDETSQAVANPPGTAAPAAEAAAYPLSDTDGATEAAADYEAAEAAAPTVSVMADSAIAPQKTVAEPSPAPQAAPAPLDEDFDLASHCFIRNRMLLTADIVPPAKEIAQQLDEFHKFDLADKQRMVPQLVLFFKGAPTFSTEGLSETQQQWFQAMEALGGDKKRKAAIWFSRYCVEPEATLAVVARVFDPSLGLAEAEEEEAAEADAETGSRSDNEAGSPREGMNGMDMNGMGMNGNMSAPPRSPRRSAGTSRAASQSHAEQSLQPAAQSQPASSVPPWFFPGIVVAGSILMMLLGLIFARPDTVAASDLCNGSAEQEYCQLATQIVDGEALEAVLDDAAPLPSEKYERDMVMRQAIANCSPFGAMNAGENFIKAFEGGPKPVNSSAREVMPGIILADVQHANVDAPGSGDVRTACLLNYQSLGVNGESWQEAVPMGDVVIPTAWPEESFESGEGYAEQVRQARAENILVRAGANLIFTAVGMFAAVMLRTAITAYSVDVLCQATLVMCIIETVMDAIVPFGIFSTFAGKSLALGLTSAIVPNFKLDWSSGYFSVLACVMVMSLVRLVLGWILFASILQGSMV